MLYWYKRYCETPLQAIDRLRIYMPIYSDIKLSYAGRLDPMASGILPILIGDECKNKEKYIMREKEYLFEILFGVETDSGDVLGVPSCGKYSCPTRESVIIAMQSCVGEFEAEYPMYSSPKLKNPSYSKSNKFSVYSIDLLGIHLFNAFDTRQDVLNRLERFVPPDGKYDNSDFRKKEIIYAWQKLEIGNVYTIARFVVHVSGGTYIRTIASQISDRLGVCGTTFRICRIGVGNKK